MKAKYSSICPACGNPIRKGDYIHFDRARHIATHDAIACMAKDLRSPEEKKADESRSLAAFVADGLGEH
jgi:hypothetical protein